MGCWAGLAGPGVQGWVLGVGLVPAGWTWDCSLPPAAPPLLLCGVWVRVGVLQCGLGARRPQALCWPGVVLHAPHPPSPWPQVVGAVGWGHERLAIPDDVRPELRDIIERCFGPQEERPSFGELIPELKKLLHSLGPPAGHAAAGGEGG